MRKRVLLLTMVVFSLFVNNIPSDAKKPVPLSSEIPAVAGKPAAPAALRNMSAATKFSSKYTPLTKCGSGLTKKEEQEAEEHGSDIPTRCKGFGGYDVYIYYSACSSVISLDRGDEVIPLATQAVDWNQKTVEWRMANGKPFAVIMRVYEYAGDDQCATSRITGQSLIVKGLKGFEHIDGVVMTKGIASLNEKARQLADKAYARGKP